MLNLARIHSISQKFAQNCSRITTKPDKIEFSDQENSSLSKKSRLPDSDQNKKSNYVPLLAEVGTPSSSYVNSRLIFTINKVPDFSKRLSTIDILTTTGIDPSSGAKFYPTNTKSTEDIDRKFDQLLNKLREIDLNGKLQMQEDENGNLGDVMLKKSLREIEPFLSRASSAIIKSRFKTNNEDISSASIKQTKDQAIQSSKTSLQQIMDIKNSMSKNDDVLSFQPSVSKLNAVNILGLPSFNRYCSKFMNEPKAFPQPTPFSTEPAMPKDSLEINKSSAINYFHENACLNLPSNAAIDIKNKLKSSTKSNPTSKTTLQFKNLKLLQIADVKTVMPSFWDQQLIQGFKPESLWSKVRKNLSTFGNLTLKLPPSFTVKSPDSFLTVIKQTKKFYRQPFLYKELTSPNQLQAQQDRKILKENLPICLKTRVSSALIAVNGKKSSSFLCRCRKPETSLAHQVTPKHNLQKIADENADQRLKGGDSTMISLPNFTSFDKAVKSLKHDKATSKKKVKKTTKVEQSKPNGKSQRTKAIAGFLLGTLVKPTINNFKSAAKEDTGRKTPTKLSKTLLMTKSIPSMRVPNLTHKTPPKPKTNLEGLSTLPLQQLPTNKKLAPNSSVQAKTVKNKTNPAPKTVQKLTPQQSTTKGQHSKKTKVSNKQQDNLKNEHTSTVTSKSAKKGEVTQIPDVHVQPAPTSILKNKLSRYERQTPHSFNSNAPRMEKTVYTITNKAKKRRSPDSICESASTLSRKRLRKALYEFLQETNTVSPPKTKNESLPQTSLSNTISSNNHSNGSKQKTNFVERNKLFQKCSEASQETLNKFNLGVEHKTIDKPRRSFVGYFKPVNINISQLLSGLLKNKS